MRRTMVASAGHSVGKVRFIVVAAMVALLFGLPVVARTAHAADFTVTTISNSGAGGNGGDAIIGSSVSNNVNGLAGADNINVSGDPTGDSDTVNCGVDSVTDSVADTVTKDRNDQTMNCDSDNVTNV
jgi:hypothetical protein